MKIFKIALPNNNIKSSNPDDYALNSLFPSPKINTLANPPHIGTIFLDWQSSLIIPRGQTNILYSFPHGYNYIPSTIAAYHFDNGSITINGILPFQYGGLGMVVVDTDSTNFNLKYYSFDPGSTTIPPFIMRIRFYVMAERGYE